MKSLKFNVTTGAAAIWKCLLLVALLGSALTPAAVASPAPADDGAESAATETPEERDEAAAPAVAGESTDTAEIPETAPWYRRIVPIPMFITEPAVGEGLGLTLAYFHPGKTASGDPPEYASPDTLRDFSDAPKPPPVVTGIFLGGTNNGTRLAGAGHTNNFRGDTIRLVAVGAETEIVTEYFPFGIPVEFELDGSLAFAELKFRLGASNFFLGFGAGALDGDIRFGVSRPPESRRDDEPDRGIRDMNLSLLGSWDTRDDTLFPSSGRFFDLKLTRHDEKLGGDYDYTRLKTKWLSFHRLNEATVLGWRLQATMVNGEPPFFGFPWVELRGIPALRYQGEEVAVAELELRRRLGNRWAATAFGGLGWTASDRVGIGGDERVGAGGIGVGYLVLPQENAWLGLDIARGPEDTAYYLRLGHPW